LNFHSLLFSNDGPSGSRARGVRVVSLVNCDARGGTEESSMGHVGGTVRVV
jgi:hypothetical protein